MKQIQSQAIAIGLAIAIMGTVPVASSQGKAMGADLEGDPSSMIQESLVVDHSSLLPRSPLYLSRVALGTEKVTVTAYSSTPEETDDTPFITASGTPVQDGIVAANFLPFGTKVKLPDLFGNKVFVVEDRMHPRKGRQIDIWFPTRQGAQNFGVEYTTLEIVEG